MRRSRLSDFNSLKIKDLKNLDNKYFKKYGVIKINDNTDIRNLEYFVHRAYEALPKKERRFIEDEKRLSIQRTINLILADGENSKMNVYNSFIERINAVKKMKNVATAEFVFKLFKAQRRSLYNMYNTYVYRLGYSSAEWFIDNFDYAVDQKYILAHISLPLKPSGKVYNDLYLKVNMSSSHRTIVEAIIS